MARWVGVAVDGSGSGDRAVDTGAAIAVAYGALLDIVTVIPYRWAYADGSAPRAVYQEDDAAYFRRRLGEYELRARAAGVARVLTSLRTGPVVEELLRHLEERTPELVVIGSAGAAGSARLRLGSVSEALLRHAPCPVLIIPPRDQPRPRPRLGEAAPL
jgi:nucleotide-binding universal stress UspA family protein